MLTNAIQFAKQHTAIDDKDLRLITLGNPYFFLVIKLRKIYQQKAALMLPWAVLMVLKYVNL